MKPIYIYTAALLAALSLPVAAQETYEAADIATEDLNGTARYVGMGGAMDALGADISTIGSNPAGIGLFRKSSVSTSFGVHAQSDQQDLGRGSNSKVSFDQIGFVWSNRVGSGSNINFAFNYHKSRNFNQILNAANKLDGSAAHKTTIAKQNYGVFELYQSGNTLASNNLTYSQCDDLYENYLLNGQISSGDDANSFDYYRANTGYIGEYDFNLSGNINDRVYLGATVGIHDVHYKKWSTYYENIPSLDGGLYMDDYRHITGSGFDIKLGAIIRPIEDSPFRFGISVHSPVFYDLKMSNTTAIQKNNEDQLVLNNEYDYKLYTPWKIGISAGHTIGNQIAIGVGYDYYNYNWMDARIDDGVSYDYWGDAYSSSYSDEDANQHIEETLKGVHTLKLGLELKPIDCFALRLGYNFVSPVYESDGVKQATRSGNIVNSQATSYISDDTYVNWRATNRFTIGCGFTAKNWTIDAAYQYSAQNGDFYPFTSCDYSYTSTTDGTTSTVNVDNVAPKTSVTNKRHQVLFTVGYKF